MGKVKNNTLKPYNLNVSIVTTGGHAMTKNYFVMPGQIMDIPKEHFDQLKKQKGFKRYIEQKALEVVGKITTKDEEEKAKVPEISATAKKLAEDNGIDIADLQPNDNGNITVDIVKAAVEAKSDDSEDDSL